MKKNILKYAITKSVEIKLKYVLADQKEDLNINSPSKTRAILNFGHTFGHALESINKYRTNLNHGEAISIGMVMAARISYKLNNINKHELEDIIDHFKKVGLPTSSKMIQKNKFYNLILSDKKNTQNNINLILLKKIGLAYYKKGLNIKKIKNLLN